MNVYGYNATYVFSDYTGKLVNIKRELSMEKHNQFGRLIGYLQTGNNEFELRYSCYGMKARYFDVMTIKRQYEEYLNIHVGRIDVYVDRDFIDEIKVEEEVKWQLTRHFTRIAEYFNLPKVIANSWEVNFIYGQKNC